MDAMLCLQGCYLVPILAFGPSNQFVGLKEASALALLLKCKLVIYGFHNQYREARGAGRDVLIPFETFFQKWVKPGQLWLFIINRYDQMHILCDFVSEMG